MTDSWVEHTVFVALCGSQAHGTAHDGSDVDVRGVCVVPLAQRLSLFARFEQHVGPLPDVLSAQLRPALAAHPRAASLVDRPAECVVMDVAKFLSLCAAANPATLEVLFAADDDVLLLSPRFAPVRAARALFLTRKVHKTFGGYALAQLRRIEVHRAWLLNPPQAAPTRDAYGLGPDSAADRADRGRLEGAIAARVRALRVDDIDMPPATRVAVEQRLDALWRDARQAFAAPDPDDPDDRDDDRDDDRARDERAAAVSALSLPRALVARLDAERRYQRAQEQWQAFLSWQKNRNPARAALERAHGYDTKHAMHLVRILQTGIEVLQGGSLRVRRPEAAQLIALREGALPYAALLAHVEALRRDLDDAAAATSLPADVDLGAVDALARTAMLASP